MFSSAALVVYWCLARQHKSQFEQLIEAARKNRAGLKKHEGSVDVTENGMKRDDGQSSTSSVELIDSEVMTSDDKHQAINEPINGIISSCLLVQKVDAPQPSISISL